jgi:heme exporter protein D
MSGHWPYIIAAYTICFSMLAIDWFASSFELKKMRHAARMRQRREEKSRGLAVNDLAVKDRLE